MVLNYLAEGGSVAPLPAARNLRIGINTWYRAVNRLDQLGLVAVTRAPGGRKIRTIEPTASGREVAGQLAKFDRLVAGSRGSLEWRLLHERPAKGSREAGEILCGLIEHAERRGDFLELRRLERQCLNFRRSGESALAAAITAFLTGKQRHALAKARIARKRLAAEGNTRSYRKALFVLGPASEYLGLMREALMIAVELRGAARRAHDLSIEADANLGIGILKARRDHLKDAAREFRKALVCARNGGSLHHEAKVLSNLCLVEFLMDPDKGEAVAAESLRVSKLAGSRIALARTETNRALMLAWRGKPKEARNAMAEARRQLAEGGEEKGKKALKAWAVLVRKTANVREHTDIDQLRQDVLAFMRGQKLAERERPGT